MRLRSICISLISSLLLLMPAGPAQAAQSGPQPLPLFTDLTEADATLQNAVMRLTALGIYDAPTPEQPDFQPEATLTRGELAYLLCQLTDQADETLAAAAGARYEDPGDPAHGWVCLATEAGYLQGEPQAVYRPGALLTGQEAVTAPLRLLGYDDRLGGGGTGATGLWPDNYNRKAEELGLLAGLTDYRADAPLTRGELAVIVNRVVDITMVIFLEDPEVQEMAREAGRGDADGFVEIQYRGSEGWHIPHNLLRIELGIICGIVTFLDQPPRAQEDGAVLLLGRIYEPIEQQYRYGSHDFQLAAWYYFADDLTFQDLTGQSFRVTYQDTVGHAIYTIEPLADDFVIVGEFSELAKEGSSS